MILLALATSGDPCSVAITNDQGLLVERTFRHRMHLSERLMGDVDGLLSDAGVGLKDVDAYAVDLGPGSFTGVRIGVTAVKTWADLFQKPVSGVSALEAWASTCFGQHADLVVPVIRARPGAVYMAMYDGDSGVELMAPAVITLDGLSAMAANWLDRRLTVCGDTAPDVRDALSEAIRQGADVVFSPQLPLRAGHFAAVAREKLSEGTGDLPLNLVPLYISPPPIGPAKR